MTRRRGQYVTSEDLAAFQADPRNSPRADFVVCFECRQKLASISTMHLRRHELTWKTYQAKWPGAPMLSSGTHAAVKKAAARFSKKHYAAHSEEINKARRTPGFRAKENPKAQKRRAANIDTHRAYDRGWYAKHRTRLAAKRAGMRAKLAAALPADWRDRSLLWRIIGMELLMQDAQEHISNDEIAARLRRLSTITIRQDSKTFLNTMTEVRKWVGRLGRRGRIAHKPTHRR